MQPLDGVPFATLGRLLSLTSTTEMLSAVMVGDDLKDILLPSLYLVRVLSCPLNAVCHCSLHLCAPCSS